MPKTVSRLRALQALPLPLSTARSAIACCKRTTIRQIRLYCLIGFACVVVAMLGIKAWHLYWQPYDYARNHFVNTNGEQPYQDDPQSIRLSTLLDNYWSAGDGSKSQLMSVSRLQPVFENPKNDLVRLFRDAYDRAPLRDDTTVRAWERRLGSALADTRLAVEIASLDLESAGFDADPDYIRELAGVFRQYTFSNEISASKEVVTDSLLVRQVITFNRYYLGKAVCQSVGPDAIYPFHASLLHRVVIGAANRCEGVAFIFSVMGLMCAVILCLDPDVDAVGKSCGVHFRKQDWRWWSSPAFWSLAVFVLMSGVYVLSVYSQGGTFFWNGSSDPFGKQIKCIQLIEGCVVIFSISFSALLLYSVICVATVRHQNLVKLFQKDSRFAKSMRFVIGSGIIPVLFAPAICIAVAEYLEAALVFNYRFAVGFERVQRIALILFWSTPFLGVFFLGCFAFWRAGKVIPLDASVSIGGITKE